MKNITKIPNLNQISISNVKMQYSGLKSVCDSLITLQGIQILDISCIY